MPSEKKSKKHKIEKPSTTSNEPMKPLAHYATDRLELTKQLFSCLKNKQIKQRLPQNLQNKSIEWVQQVCLDEILGISTKRLISIINNTRCPDNTDSDDSELEKAEEHVSLEEISSDSEAEALQKKVKEPTKKAEPIAKSSKEKSKNPKEMTMLELLELQARARAIRSQLALEPVTKIDLGSDDDDEEGNLTKNKGQSLADDKLKEPSPVAIATPTTKHIEKKRNDSHERRIVVPPPPPAKPTKPLKLKRNYKTQTSQGDAISNIVVPREPTPPKIIENEGNIADDEDDDDVIRMEPSPETFFISDSDEEPPLKKSPTREEEPEEAEKFSEASVKEDEPDKVVESEDGEISEKETKVTSPEVDKPPPESPPKSKPVVSTTDDDSVHITSDTEIELHHQSDKEDDEAETAPEPEEKTEKLEISPRKSPEPHLNVQSDDDVVEINNSSDDDIMNDSGKSAGESSKNSETWEQRWLSSSKTQSILKTTQLASKVRINMLKTRSHQKETAKKKQENDKAMKEKILNAEEGSMEQFKFIKENSN